MHKGSYDISTHTGVPMSSKCSLEERESYENSSQSHLRLSCVINHPTARAILFLDSRPELAQSLSLGQVNSPDGGPQ